MSLLIHNLTPEEMEQINKLPPNILNKILKAGFGAHNQKSIIEIKVELLDNSKNNKMWIEDLVEIERNNSSSPTYTVLKRPDEKYVTEVAYLGGYFDEKGEFIKTNGGPAFVEDISRKIAQDLNTLLDVKIKDYVIIVNNQESIHSGDITATSILTAGRELK